MDPCAPRFRKKFTCIKVVELYKKAADNPLTEHLNFKEVQHILDTYHAISRKKIAETRDGIELPGSLGFIFVGAIARGNAVDLKSSKYYDKKINFQNWESDNYLAKIYYTNYETKYQFRYRRYWMFDAGKELRQQVSREFSNDYTKYVQPGNRKVISFLFRAQNYKHKHKDLVEKELEDYNEFDLI